jgi:hypothetical protein
MKKYSVLHHEIGTNKKGERTWINPIEKRQISVDEKHADELNSQFENTGIKYELIEEKKKKEK